MVSSHSKKAAPQFITIHKISCLAEDMPCDEPSALRVYLDIQDAMRIKNKVDFVRTLENQNIINAVCSLLKTRQLYARSAASLKSSTASSQRAHSIFLYSGVTQPTPPNK